MSPLAVSMFDDIHAKTIRRYAWTWGELCERFANARQVSSSCAGLVPRRYQSGLMDRQGGITHRGWPLLRSALVECAWHVSRSGQRRANHGGGRFPICEGAIGLLQRASD